MIYSVTLNWERKAAELFIDGKYSRVHEWTFDGGARLIASSSPLVVPEPLSDASAMDPEESFIASLSACHLLFFLSIAASKKYTVEKYLDHPQGYMGKNDVGKMMMKTVKLHPKVTFSGETIPTADKVKEMHGMAHDRCYLASSVKCAIEIIPE